MKPIFFFILSTLFISISSGKDAYNPYQNRESSLPVPNKIPETQHPEKSHPTKSFRVSSLKFIKTYPLKKAYKKQAKSDFTPIFSILGFCFSMMGLMLLLLIGFPFLLGTLGLIFSIIGLSKGESMKGLSIAGITIGVFTILLMWLVIAAFTFLVTVFI